jgi:hypothetical protein
LVVLLAPAAEAPMIRRQLSFVVVFAVLSMPVFGQEAGIGQVSERTANSGNVVLSGIPEVPPEISARLQRYQNTRSAGSRRGPPTPAGSTSRRGSRRYRSSTAWTCRAACGGS